MNAYPVPLDATRVRRVRRTPLPLDGSILSEQPKHLDGPSPSGQPIAVGDDAVVHQWADRLGVTVEMLRAGIEAVGPMPAALATYFTSRGARRKVITDAMRAAGRPKRNRQSWRRGKTDGQHSS